MPVSFTIASGAGAGSAGCCGWLLTGAGVAVGEGLGAAAPVRRRGVWATAIAAPVISMIEMIKSLVRFIAAVVCLIIISRIINLRCAFDKLSHRLQRIDLVNRLVRPQAYDAWKAQSVATLVTI